MAKKDKEVAIAAGLFTLGLGAILLGASAAKSDKRATFTTRLRDHLTPYFIGLVYAELGRDQNQPVWILSIRLPNQHVVTVHAPVPDGDPVSDEVCDDIAARLVRYVDEQLVGG